MANIFDQLLDKPGAIRFQPGTPDTAALPQWQGPPLPDDIDELMALADSPPLVDVPTKEDEALADSPPLVDIPTKEDVALAESPPLVAIPSKRQVLSYRETSRKESKKGDAGKEKLVGGAEDELLKQYKDKAGSLEKDRIKALETAAAEKDLSNEEKIAMALLAALPGLVGAIGGGAIGGGWGAAAGAAGGLRGGAEGMQGIAASKKERRKEAKGDAEKLLEQIGQQEGLATRRKETLEGREIDTKKAAEQRAFEQEMLRTKEAGDDRRSRAQIEATLTAHKMDNSSRDYQAQLNAQTDIEKARIAAKNAGKQQGDVEYATNAAMLLNGLRDLDATIEKYGTKEVATWFANPETAKAAGVLDTNPQLLATMIPKLMDPSTAAREGEVEAAKNTILQMGTLTDPEKAQAAIRFLSDFMQRHIKARQLAREGRGAEEIAKMVGGSKYLPGKDSSDWTGASMTVDDVVGKDWRSTPGISWDK